MNGKGQSLGELTTRLPAPDGVSFRQRSLRNELVVMSDLLSGERVVIEGDLVNAADEGSILEVGRRRQSTHHKMAGRR